MEEEKLKNLVNKCFQIFYDAELTLGECREVLKEAGLYLDEIAGNVILVACPKE